MPIEAKLRFPEELHAAIKALAARNKRTMNGEVQMALENWLRIHDPNYMQPVNRKAKR